jgi:LemA protein
MMGSFFTALLVVVVIVGLLVMFAISVYNGLVGLRNRFKNAFAQIDVQLKRRYDLIPNLVEVAKGYMKHESETLQNVIEARNRAFKAGQSAAANPGDPTAISQLGQAESQLNGALSRLLMVAEAYPDLKANTNMIALQEELTSTENKVAYARQGYNDSVMQYNTAREKFPAVLFSGALGFREAQLLEIENPKEREAPQVKF